MKPEKSEPEKTPCDGEAWQGLPPQDAPALNANWPKIKKLLRFTSGRHPIRRLVDAETGLLIEAPDAAARLCKILREAPLRQWRERTAAALALRQVALSPAEARYAARVLGDVMNSTEPPDPDAKYERAGEESWHILGRTVAGIACISLVGIANGIGLLPEILSRLIDTFGIALFAASMLCIPILLLTSANNQMALRVECATTLWRLRLPESVRSLAVLAQSRYSCAGIGQKALLEILPLLTLEHCGQLETGTIPKLCGLIRTYPLPPFETLKPLSVAEAALHALEKVGDGQAVKPVKWFVEHCKNEKLRDKAAAILPVLQARQALEEAHGILLRGASAPAAPETLLRAANATPETAPETLLRASEKE